MTKRLLKTKADHRRVRSLMTEATHAIALLPAAGALTAGTNGVAHAGVTFTSSDAEGTPAYAVVAGTIPAGMVFDGTAGTLTGTPTTAGANSFSVRVTDGMGNTKTNAYTLAVA